MNINAKKYYSGRIIELINLRGPVRVSEVASWTYINKARVRRLLDWMVSAGYLYKKTFKYAGNANMNVYSKK